MKVTRIWHSGNGSYIELEQIDKIEEVEKIFEVDSKLYNSFLEAKTAQDDLTVEPLSEDGKKLPAIVPELKDQSSLTGIFDLTLKVDLKGAPVLEEGIVDKLINLIGI